MRKTFGNDDDGLNALKAKLEVAPYTTIPNTLADRAGAGACIRDQMIAMRDGCCLATDVYLPDTEPPYPTILTRMPYGKTEPYCYMPVIAAFWVQKGYAAVVQDVRGKWGSQGIFEPNLQRNEVADAYDTIDWIATQSWSNARVGMWGESYFGFTSYAGALSGHHALRCIAPGDISLDRYHATMRNGCLQLNTVGTWAISMSDQTYQDLSALDYWHLPLADLAAAGGVTSDYFDQVIANPKPSAFWAERSLLAGYDRIDIPVLHWGGWYDNYLGPTLRDWRYMADKNKAARHQHLFIGPWDHEGTPDRTGRAGIMPICKGTAAARWDHFCTFFDRYLMNCDHPFDGDKLVRYFVMGKDEWRDADCWPPEETLVSVMYLHSSGEAGAKPDNGRLDRSAPSHTEPCDVFIYDPDNPVADTLSIDCWAIAEGLGDRQHIAQREDVLVYTSEPFVDGLELTGPITARLFFASSACDTDVTVALVDVFVDGRSNLIQDGILRTSYRFGAEAVQLSQPGEVYELEIDLWATSYFVRPHHRLRVEISSSCFNRYDRNPNTGEPFGLSTHAIKATQRVYHDVERASHLLLPIFQGST